MENKRIGRLAPIDEGGKLTPQALTYRRLEVLPRHSVSDDKSQMLSAQ